MGRTITQIIGIAVATWFFAALSAVLITLHQTDTIAVHFVMPPPPMPQEQPTIEVSGCAISFNPTENTISFEHRSVERERPKEEKPTTQSVVRVGTR